MLVLESDQGSGVRNKTELKRELLLREPQAKPPLPLNSMTKDVL